MPLLVASILLAAIHVQDSVFPPEIQAVADRPNVFKTRVYQPLALPTFERAKAQLPEPIISEHPEWVDMYWKTWQLAFKHLKQPEPGSGFVSNFIDPAFNSNTFQWDTCFMLQYAHYAEPVFHAIGSLDNFYAKEHEDGYICREISRKTGEDFLFGGVDNTINPPLFSWVEWQNYTLTGDKSRFREVLPPLIKYYGWLKLHRRREDGFYWNTGLGSGEDDLTRSNSAYDWVDMTAQQAQNAFYISRIAQELGETATASYFNSEVSKLGNLVGAKMWDPKTGFFYDLKKDGAITGIKTVLGFWPLLAHLVLPKQVKQLTAHLTDPKEFYRGDVVPALAADEPGYSAEGQYWNGAVWAPTNFMVVKGLEEYGYEDLASRLTAIYLANMARVLRQTGTIWENYAPEYAEGHGVKDMVGWSGDGPIALLIENILGVRASAASHTVFWRPRLGDRNGIRNLTVGTAKVTLVAGKAVFQQRELNVTTTEPINLRVDTGESVYRDFKVPAGHSTITVAAPNTFTYTYPTVAPPNPTYKENPQDLALSGTVTSSSDSSSATAAALAIDGKDDTQWVSGESLPQSLTVDLREMRPIGWVHLYWGAAFARSYSIEGSADGSRWRKLFETQSGKGGVEFVPIIGIQSRYLRLVCQTANDDHKNISLREFEVLGP